VRPFGAATGRAPIQRPLQRENKVNENANGGKAKQKTTKRRGKICFLLCETSKENTFSTDVGDCDPAAGAGDDEQSEVE
jgi:hypothetical protein